MVDQTDREYQRYDAQRARFSRLLREFEEDDELERGDFYVLQVDGMEEDLDITRPPTARDTIDNAADHILSFPKVRCFPRRVSDEKQAEEDALADRKQAWLSMLWQHWYEDDGDPMARAIRSIIKGKAVFKISLDWKRLPARSDMTDDQYRAAVEKANRSRQLISLDLIPKETVYEDFSRPWDPRWVFEAYEITYEAAARMLDEMERGEEGDRAPLHTWLSAVELRNHIRSTAEHDPLGKVQYVEYWEKPEGKSRGKFIQWIDGIRIHAAHNPYSWESPLHTEDEPDYDGFLPYDIGTSGWGEHNKEQEPEAYYVSIVKSIRSVVTAEARYLTMLDYGLRFYTFKPLVTTNMGDKALENAPGAVWDTTEDQKIDVIQFGELPISLLQGLDRVGNYVDRTAKLGALGGQAQRGVDTATEADQNSRNAATKLSRPIQQLTRMARRINTKALQIVEHVVEAPVSIYGVSAMGVSEARLTPTEIGGHYYSQVELGTSDEEYMNTRNAVAWGNVAQILPIQFKTAMRKAGIENPSDELLGRMAEDLERSPAAQQVLLLTMLAGMGEQGQVVSTALQQSLAAILGGSGGGQPPGDQAALPQGNVETTRTTARDEAIQNAPERSFA